MGDLATELYRIQQSGSAPSNLSLPATLRDATAAYNELGLFEDSVELCRRCGDSESLIGAALAWTVAQPSQMQIVINIVSKLHLLDQLIIRATDSRLFDVAMQLCDSTATPEKAKLDVWYRQGMILERDHKLTEAEHAYVMA